MTYSDAVRTIEFYASKGDQCMITVQSNLEGKLLREKKREREKSI